MASYWRQIAEQIGATDTPGRSWEQKVVNFFEAAGEAGRSWVAKLRGVFSDEQAVGSDLRRIVPTSGSGIRGRSWAARALRGEIFLGGTEATAPENLSAPTILGTPKEGEVLQATTGVWDDGGSPITAFMFSWFVDDELIEDATGNTYIPQSADVGKRLMVEVVATNDVGFGVALSDQTGVIQLATTAPVNTVRPTISGVARSGETLALTSNGTWTGNGDEILDFDYQWFADDVAMPGKTGTTLALTDTEVGKRIHIRVTAINSIGSTAATSLKTAAVIAAVGFPGIVTAPAISGDVKSGSILTVSDGVWNAANGTISGYTYEWFADDTALTGEVANTLNLTDDHIGMVIRAEVTATNETGSTTATTEGTVPVAPMISAPINTVAPTYADGVWRAGKPRTVNDGTWDDGGDAISGYTYQWFNYTNNVDIVGETSATYTPGIDMVGKRVRAKVTATNSAGSTTALAPVSSLIANGYPPSKIESPTLVGAMHVGETITCDPGEWDGVDFPITSYAYQWQYRSGSSFLNISGATSSTYLIPPEMQGFRIRCQVTVSNAAGSTSAVTALGASIQPALEDPVNTSTPSITGTLKRNNVLTANTGTWTGYPTPTFTYQWYADDVAISGATGSTFTPQLEHVDAMIHVVVTGTNAGGSADAASPAVGPIGAGDLPVNASLPVISGVAKVGVELTTSNGEWTLDLPANPIDNYSYQWLADDVAISGADASSYTPVEGQEGAVITVDVTAHTGAGNVTATSAGTDPVEAAILAPENTVLPAISSLDPIEGTEITTTTGTWDDGGDTISGYTHQWLRDGVDITGATASAYTPVADDVGTQLSVRVTATNSVGSTSATSAATNAVLASGSFRPATTAYLAAMSVEPDQTRKELIDTLIATLQDAGVWSKLDILGIHAAHDEQARRVNAVDPTMIATAVGTDTFIADRGVVGNNSDFYLDWGVAANALPNVQQNDATYAAYPIDNPLVGSTRAVLLGCAGSSIVRIAPRVSGTSSTFGLHASAAANFGQIADQRGLIGGCRRDSATTNYRHRKTELGIHSRASVSVPAANVATLHYGSAFGLSTVAFTVVGGALSDTEWNVLSDALDAYATAVGITVDW